MRCFLVVFSAFLSLQPMFFETGYAKEDINDLDSFMHSIQKISLSLERWYAHYVPHTPRLAYGQCHDINKDFYLSGSTLQIMNWISTNPGSGLSANICSINNMHLPVIFKNNLTMGDGAGVYAATEFVATNNQVPICFDHNISWENGGGIGCPKLVRFENNSAPIYFLNNIGNGAAIYSNSLVIKNCGYCFFFRNTSIYSPSGAAIYMTGTSKGELNLSADNGPIIFCRNQLLASGPRNAIKIEKIINTYLGAKKYHSIQFYDPITLDTDNGTTLTFNPEKDHQGYILFSSLDVVPNQDTMGSRFSYFRQPCSLENGIINVTDGAGLACYQFTQNGGVLSLGNSATITTVAQKDATTSGCNLSITQLALDLPSITKQQASPPKFWIYPQSANNSYTEDTNPTITISGDLIFLDKDGNDPYDSMDLSQPLLAVPLLQLWDNAQKKINVNLNLDGINTQQHYGYQGTWKFYWTDQAMVTNPTSAFTANSSRSTLYGDWTPVKYVPNPKYNSPLVANAIWESVYTLIPGMKLEAMFDDHTASYLDGEIVGMVHLQNSHEATPGFHMRTKSYWTGGKYAGLQSQKLYLHFGQSFSHIKEKRTKNKLDSKNYGVTFKVNSSIKDDFLYLSASLGYAYGTHKVQHFYPDPNNHFSTGEFFSSTISVFAHLLRPLNFSLFDRHVSSFVEAHLFQSFLSSFQETGANPRSFKTNRPFFDLTLPIGVVISSQEQALGCPNWSCRLAYQPTVYRDNPSILTTFLASHGSWVSSGTKVARNALNVQLNSEMELSCLLLRCSYEGSFSLTTVCNYATLKGVLKF